MSKKSDAMKRKAKAMAKEARPGEGAATPIQARAKVELKRHQRAFMLAAKRYKLALKNS